MDSRSIHDTGVAMFYVFVSQQFLQSSCVQTEFQRMCGNKAIACFNTSTEMALSGTKHCDPAEIASTAAQVRRNEA